MPFQDIRSQAKRRSQQGLIEHMNSFELDLKFSAGVWFFSPGGGRFHERYTPNMDIKGRLKIAGDMAEYGLQAVEAHYPGEVNEDTYHLYQQMEKDTGVRLCAVGVGIFYDAQYEWGALSSPIPSARKNAIGTFARSLAFAKEANLDHVIHWPGIDGWENSFGQDFIAMRDRFSQGLAEAMDQVPGVRVTIEPKPYEPRGRIIYGTTSEGLLLAQKIESHLTADEHKKMLAEGHAMVAMNPEMGHILMGYEDPPYAWSLCMEYGRLGHTHWNSQPLGNYDQDLNAGVISPEQLESSLYVLKMHGYQGYYGPDLNPERMSVQQALKNNFDALSAANDRINSLDNEKVITSTMSPDRNRGWLEAYLIRARASNPDILSEMPAWEE
jgi:xylose isomerase